MTTHCSKCKQLLEKVRAYTIKNAVCIKCKKNGVSDQKLFLEGKENIRKGNRYESK